MQNVDRNYERSEKYSSKTLSAQQVKKPSGLKYRVYKV